MSATITIEEIKNLMEENKAKGIKRKENINKILSENSDNENLAICKALNFDTTILQAEVKKDYPLPEYQTKEKDFIFSDKFSEGRKLFTKHFGESLKLPKEHTLLIGDNGIGKTPIIRYWNECLRNKIKDIWREELIAYENNESNWCKDLDKKKYDSFFIRELDIYERYIDTKHIPDYSKRTGYLFLDDILQDEIWNDEKNFNHATLIVEMTKFYESLRDDYSGKLIVVATTNHYPTVEAMANNTRIQSRIMGVFKNRIIL